MIVHFFRVVFGIGKHDTFRIHNCKAHLNRLLKVFDEFLQLFTFIIAFRGADELCDHLCIFDKMIAGHICIGILQQCCKDEPQDEYQDEYQDEEGGCDPEP